MRPQDELLLAIMQGRALLPDHAVLPMQDFATLTLCDDGRTGLAYDAFVNESTAWIVARPPVIDQPLVLRVYGKAVHATSRVTVAFMARVDAISASQYTDVPIIADGPRGEVTLDDPSPETWFALDIPLVLPELETGQDWLIRVTRDSVHDTAPGDVVVYGAAVQAETGEQP